MKKHTMKTMIAAFLLVALSTSMVFAAEIPADVAGQPCENAVKTLMEEGIITGDTDGLYHPDSSLTRAQVSVLLERAMKSETAAPAADLDKTGFSDLSGYQWAASAIYKLEAEKIAKGYPDGTFRPGASVTVGELTTFVVRACGYEDNDLATESWPDNYISQAKRMGLYENLDGTENVNAKATKGQAAILIFNALEEIQEAQTSSVTEAGYVFGKLQFNSTMDQVNGIALSPEVKVYAYEQTKNYTKDMTLPQKGSLAAESVYKYKNVSTVGFYKLTEGRISEIILPGDCGFSGRVYGIITETYTATNVKGQTVTGIDTIAAGQEISWNCRQGVIVPENSIAAGNLAEIVVSRGEVRSISYDPDAMVGKEDFKYLGGTGQSWKAVIEKVSDRQLYKMEGNPEDPYVAYRDTTVVYILNEDCDGYDVGTVRNIKKGDSLRIYDISDDDNDEADIIFVKKN